MGIEKNLFNRNGDKCELCNSANNLSKYNVPPYENSDNEGHCIAVCETCNEQINQSEITDANHFKCLKDTMWSQVPAVQVVAWRLLKKLSNEPWAVNLLDMLYLDEGTLTWAKANAATQPDNENSTHMDSNGVTLNAGDTVVLIKDLNVKGANFVAKRGTAVRKISLVADNPEHIEGRVNGQQIVILTKFVKKTG